MSLGVFKIRPSSLPSFADCERRAIASLFHGKLEGMGWKLRGRMWGIGAVVGTAVHRGVELSLREKMATGKLCPESTATDAAVQSVADDYKSADFEVVPDKTSPNASAARDQVARMVRSYRRHVAPGLNPTLVEGRLECEINPRVIISGQSDVMTGEPGRIRDTKTGVKKRAHQAQLGAYRILARAHGHDVNETVEDFVPRVGVTKEQPPPITHVYDPEISERSAVAAIFRLIASVEEFERRLKDGDAPPEDAFLANPQSALCSVKFCPAHGTKFCREWRADDPKED